jgi:hypothetical protein
MGGVKFVITKEEGNANAIVIPYYACSFRCFPFNDYTERITVVQFIGTIANEKAHLISF